MQARAKVGTRIPCWGWNTDTLLTEASKGAESTGAEIERFDLFHLEKYTGCISCFGCKKEKFKGHCICKDGLTPVLDAIRKADGLIIGSPNYLGDLTASFRALYERLVFQNLTYNADTPCCNQNVIPVLLIMTSNSPDTTYLDKMKNYQQVLTMFVGPTELFISGDTQGLQQNRLALVFWRGGEAETAWDGLSAGMQAGLWDGQHSCSIIHRKTPRYQWSTGPGESFLMPELPCHPSCWT